MIMLIKNAEKLRKTTLRERIYEEVAHTGEGDHAVRRMETT